MNDHQWEKKQIAAGNCGQCGKPRSLYSHLCDEHALEKRVRERERLGCLPHRVGGPGRPPNCLKVTQ